VNVIAYYSSSIFADSGFSDRSALAASLGFGVINFGTYPSGLSSTRLTQKFTVFAIPAIYTIDTFGRRNLLLTTFPLMSIFLLFTGFSFWIPSSPETSSTARVSCIALGIYLFGIVYSPGEGPVPFTYSAEAYPLYVRTIGMSLATATTWFFNGVLGVTWPSLQRGFKPQGAFGFYAAWNIVGWWGVLLFLPVSRGNFIRSLFLFQAPSMTLGSAPANASVKGNKGQNT
jgi:MFS family permease